MSCLFLNNITRFTHFGYVMEIHTINLSVNPFCALDVWQGIDICHSLSFFFSQGIHKLYLQLTSFITNIRQNPNCIFALQP